MYSHQIDSLLCVKAYAYAYKGLARFSPDPFCFFTRLFKMQDSIFLPVCALRGYLLQLISIAYGASGSLTGRFGDQPPPSSFSCAAASSSSRAAPAAASPFPPPSHGEAL